MEAQVWREEVRTCSSPWGKLEIVWEMEGERTFFAEGHGAEDDVEVCFGGHFG